MHELNLCHQGTKTQNFTNEVSEMKKIFVFLPAFVSLWQKTTTKHPNTKRPENNSGPLLLFKIL